MGGWVPRHVNNNFLTIHSNKTVSKPLLESRVRSCANGENVCVHFQTFSFLTFEFEIKTEVVSFLLFRQASENGSWSFIALSIVNVAPWPAPELGNRKMGSIKNVSGNRALNLDLGWRHNIARTWRHAANESTLPILFGNRYLFRKIPELLPCCPVGGIWYIFVFQRWDKIPKFTYI